jgi:lipopolysaccharide export system protein LptA
MTRGEGSSSRSWLLRICSLVSAVCCFLLFSVHADAQLPKKISMDKNEPINIRSDRLDAYQEKKMVVFSGHAVATQGDRTIHADRLLIYYKDSSTNTKNKKDLGTAGDLDKIEAQGHVVITQTGRTVTGDNALFLMDSQQIVMTGNAVMQEGKNTVKGEKIVVYLNEDRGVIEGSKQKRVEATIYPNEKNEGKQK